MARFRIAMLAALLAALPIAAKAALLDFAFTFTNVENGGGTVTGVVRGLADNATSAASSVEVLTNTAGFGIGEYVGNPDFNTWTVLGGVITSFDFVSFGADNSLPAVTCCSLAFVILPPGLGPSGPAAGLRTDPNVVVTSPSAGLQFTPLAPSAVPGPSAALLLASALTLGGIAVRRRARAA